MLSLTLAHLILNSERALLHATVGVESLMRLQWSWTQIAPFSAM